MQANLHNFISEPVGFFVSYTQPWKTMYHSRLQTNETENYPNSYKSTHAAASLKSNEETNGRSEVSKFHVKFQLFLPIKNSHISSEA